jgi:hypothetical protein
MHTMGSNPIPSENGVITVLQHNVTFQCFIMRFITTSCQRALKHKAFFKDLVSKHPLGIYARIEGILP